ncbi:MAG: rhamnogalacturonan acetylesterase [Verrucomicrobia bacterium]|nr:rhamnogalacturonan acetylesterase [Verrucomicrobiota bacterium]
MQRRIFLSAAIFPALVCVIDVSHAADAKGEVRIAVIGDSTVCEYPAESNIRGWGHFLAPAFQEHVRIINLAKSGRSTKTFIKEGLWTKTLAQKPDFVLIQFGHNDSHGKDRPESTDAATDYRDFLRRYVDEARAAGATPVLVTPMHRRRFDANGKVTQELLPYADAMKAVAKEKQAALVDLHAASGELFEKLGDEGSADLSCSTTDRTHFSEKGAKAMAGLVLKSLPDAEPRLKALLKK